MIWQYYSEKQLWLAFSSHSDLMLADMRENILAAYEIARTTEGAPQPCKKRLVTVHGRDTQVFMEVVISGDDDGVNNCTNNGPIPVTPDNPRPQGNNAPTRQVLLSLIGQTHSLRRAITEQSNSIELLRGTVSFLRRTQVRLCRRVESNPLHQLHRAASRRPAPPNNTPSPARRNVQQADAYVDPHAVLYPSIRNLHDLWKEYIQGIGNNKPAREFTATERGKCKCKYSRRKVF